MTQPAVHLNDADGRFSVVTPHYHLVTRSDRPFVGLCSPDGSPIADLFIASSVHITTGQDDTLWLGPWQAETNEHGITLSIAASSSAWRQKIYRFHCTPERFWYDITVIGEGHLTAIQYFGGYYSGTVRWGSGFFPSGQLFREGWTPEPNTDEIQTFSPAESSVIDLMGVPLPGRGDWFFTPPPFCFAFAHEHGWVGMGVEAAVGEHHFTAYHYHGKRKSFHLELAYEGHTTVNGSYTLPAIGFDFAPDPYSALEAHCYAARQRIGMPMVPNNRNHWWTGPIFCGWGAQCHLAAVERGHATSYSRQRHYNHFLATLADNELHPGIVVLDDKWQATYGENAVDSEKWPDLAGFVAEQHAHDRRVLLWLKLWDCEGLPADECVRNAAGMPVAVDPTNPRFEQRLRASVRTMLGAEGYNADGFKIDFSARTPSGPGMQHYGEAWGLELMKQYLSIIYSEAKRAKPDALVMTHTPHPYLADVTDMIRLNDVNIGAPIVEAMAHRARVAGIACPGALIDTDNWPVTNRASWRAYLQIQSELGIPSLYYADCIDSTSERLEAEDYQMLRDVWSNYAVARERLPLVEA